MVRAALSILIAIGVVFAAGCGSDEAAETTPTDPTPIGVQAEASDAEASEPDGPQPRAIGFEAPGPDEIDAELYPIVIDAAAAPDGDSSWRFDVTLSSEYDTPERYADAWRVLDVDDTELGIRVLTHDHANEQPFTRSTTVDVPSDITTVFIEGRDQDNGWSGQRFELELPPLSDA